MSGKSVCVLCPNGRRNNVKYNPNTTILQILEEVCQKQNLKAKDYELKHHNKILDLSEIFRFSGIPNKAQLELIPATKVRLESDITLAVNLENGNRLVEKFIPSQTLRNVLEKLCPEYLSDGKSPVVVYMRQEIFGENLETVTLRSLGITGGRAMIRILDKLPEELKTQANVAVPLPHKPMEGKLHVGKNKESSCDKTHLKLNTDKKEFTSDVQKNVYKNIQSKDVNKGAINVLIAKEKRKNTDLCLSKEKRQNVMSEDTDVMKMSIPDSITQDEIMCKCMSNEIKICSGKFEETCVNFSEKNIEDQFVFLGERNAMLFSLETAQAIPSEDLPDDFFELTIDDAKKLLRDVRMQQHVMLNRPLLTTALRNLDESKKQLRQLNKYKKAIIRIQFPDRTVLQGTFKSTETIQNVMEFVSEYLEDKLVPFHLYSTPPKEILDDSKTLIQLGFVPGALIHFGADNTEFMKYLRTDLQDKFTSNSVASLAAAKIRSQISGGCNAYEICNVDLNMDGDVSDVTYDTPSTSTGITHTNENITSSTRSWGPK